jgi:hypothetical protein
MYVTVGIKFTLCYSEHLSQLGYRKQPLRKERILHVGYTSLQFSLVFFHTGFLHPFFRRASQIIEARRNGIFW